MATKRCVGYTSNGEAGVSYSQPSHELENTEANFSPGKSQCRRCYGAYANDWRAMRSFAPQVRRAERRGERVSDSTDTTHVCVDGTRINDTDAPLATNERRDAWCSRCGERLLLPGYVGGPMLCICGHPFTSHQTGAGPWTGFCYGTLGQLGGEYVRPGDDPNEPCRCEAPAASD